MPNPSATDLPDVDFTTFVLSLGASVLHHLGELPDEPGDHEATATGHQAHKDLAMAKHTIDTLAMLQAKTRGNLTTDEANVLDELLMELRLKYVHAIRDRAIVLPG
jgi:hypothetical protein